MPISRHYRREVSKRIPEGAQRFCEVGAAHGFVSARVLDEHPTIEAYLIDTWYWEEYTGSGRQYVSLDKTMWRDVMVSAMERLERFYERTHMIQLESSMAALSFPDGWFDLVFVDMNKDQASVLRDIETWFPKTAILCGRYYGNIRVANAVKEFAVPRNLVVDATRGGLWEIRHGHIWDRAAYKRIRKPKPKAKATGADPS